MMIWVELCILLACILIGARLGGIALGTVAGIGLIIFYVGLSVVMIMLHMMHIFFLGLLIYPLLWLLIFVTLIFMMYKAYQHEKFKLPVIGDFAENLANK